jgi:twitching motility protein PilJ
MAINIKSLFKGGSTEETSAGEGSAFERQLRALGGVFVISILLAAAAGWVQTRNSAQGAAFVKVASELRTLAQGMPKDVRNVAYGDAGYLVQLTTSRNRFHLLLERLTNGSDAEGVSVPSTSAASRPALDSLQQKVWAPLDALIAEVLQQQDGIVVLGTLTSEAVRHGPALSAAAEASGGRLPLLTERILHVASHLTLTHELDELAVLQLGRDLAATRELAPAGGGLAKEFDALQKAYAALPADMRPVVKARAALVKAQALAGGLAPAADELAVSYEREFDTSWLVTLSLAFFGSVALVVLAVIVMLYNHEAIMRRKAAEDQRHLVEAEKEVTQNAILRLLNEMSDLADGDLTVRTTVTEDITGAIADSVNFAIEELATLVRRLNDAAERVTHTTDQAQTISHELLTATETQAGEIRHVSSSVLATADSMSVVSISAQESAQVALASVDAAQKGASAVADSISGMNEIRGQIQETSKRIKRLGESSQEIGEIVELISDITEQTNVLALNAAIQAASAGEAGRGFSVVAEEVQRLAERSAGATKQIAALVKTIQTDTHDAVAAMEQSTQGVVEGAKLSDAAGQSLAEISSVSQDLAQRVKTIASATQAQAKNATEVAVLMQDILRITDQTTAGTQQTARSVAELAALAIELKGSVAGFKV